MSDLDVNQDDIVHVLTNDMIDYLFGLSERVNQRQQQINQDVRGGVYDQLLSMRVKIAPGRSGKWRVERFYIGRDESEFGYNKYIYSEGGRGFAPVGWYTKLTRSGQIIMSDTPDEIRDHLPFIQMSRGDVLVTGLGLGMVAEQLLKRDEVSTVTIIEQSRDVWRLVAPILMTRYGKRLTVIVDDAYSYTPSQRYDMAWHDIWDDISTENLPKMARLEQHYAPFVGYQQFWSKSFWSKSIVERVNNDGS
jgi:hypothetical protein